MRLHLLSILVFISTISWAQEETKKEYEKLQKLYDNGKYEDCAYKADLLSSDDKHRKDAEPYLYISMSFYRISQDEQLSKMYPKAYDDALKAAAKARDKDEDGHVYKENIDFFTELKETGVNEISVLFNEEDYKKASTPLKKVYKFNEDDYALLFSLGVCDLVFKNSFGGKEDIKTAVDSLKVQLINKSFKKEVLTEDVFAKSFVFYTDYLVQTVEDIKSNIKKEEEGYNNPQKLEELNNELTLMKDSAAVTIKFGKELLPNNAIVADQYNKLVK